METYFASPERADSSVLDTQLSAIAGNPLINTVCDITNSLLAILNSNRQIIALNKMLLDKLNISNVNEVLGLRPGEAVGCIHAQDMEGGCGTGPFCETCGAAIAIVSSLAGREPIEKLCALKSAHNGIEVETILRVRAHPFVVDENTFLLLFLDDVSEQSRNTVIQNVFMHDLKNCVSGLLGTFQFAKSGKFTEKSALEVSERYTHRIISELEMQQAIAGSQNSFSKMNKEKLFLKLFFLELKNSISHLPVAKNKIIDIKDIDDQMSILTYPSILNRVLLNMILNALEATSEWGSIMVWVEKKANTIDFKVLNNMFIPESVQKRIFQRHFSTKDSIGRGFGTYSIKLFGEKYLGGKVSFTSDPVMGTVFQLSL